LLAAPSTPPAARAAIAEKVRTGERVTHRNVVEAVRAAHVFSIPRATQPPPVAEQKPAVNFLLYTSVIETHARRLFEGEPELWHDVIRHQADMPTQYRQCTASDVRHAYDVVGAR